MFQQRKDKRGKIAHKHSEIGVVISQCTQQLLGDDFLGGQTLAACRLSSGGNNFGQRDFGQREQGPGLDCGKCGRDRDIEWQSPEARDAEHLLWHCICCWFCSSAGYFVKPIEGSCQAAAFLRLPNLKTHTL